MQTFEAQLAALPGAARELVWGPHIASVPCVAFCIKGQEQIHIQEFATSEDAQEFVDKFRDRREENKPLVRGAWDWFVQFQFWKRR